MVRSFYRLGVQGKCCTKSVACSSYKLFTEQIKGTGVGSTHPDSQGTNNGAVAVRGQLRCCRECPQAAEGMAESLQAKTIESKITRRKENPT